MKMTLETIPDIANGILDKARNLKTDLATVISLSGELGSGKTTLSKELAKQLGVNESVISPTFVIMKRYTIKDKNFTQLFHIDAYRLDDSAELEKLGWENILKEKNNLIVIEWPENVSSCIPRNAIKIKLTHTDEHTRTIEY